MSSAEPIVLALLLLQCQMVEASVQGGVTSIVAIWQQEVVSNALYLMGVEHYVMSEVCGVLRSTSGETTIFSRTSENLEKYCAEFELGIIGARGATPNLK